MLNRFRSLKRLSLACAVVGLIVAQAELRSAESWVEVQSMNFRVVSNHGERSARQTAWQFEQIRAGIMRGWPWAQAPLDRPLLIIGVKDEATMKSFAPGDFEPGQSLRYSSTASSDWDRHYIVIRTDLWVDGEEGVNPYRNAYWSYCDLMLSSAFRSRLPIWFTRGIAAVLSNTNVTNKEVQFGRAMPSYVVELQSGGRFSLEQLFAMNRQSPEFQRRVDRQRFDSQAWALMHYLLFGDPDTEGRERRLNALSSALTAAVPSAEAVESVYGSLATLDAAYRRYVDRNMFRYAVLKTEIQISAKGFAVRPVEAGQLAAIRAGYLAASARPVDARSAIAQARQLSPNSPASYEVEGLLLERETRADEARVAYEKAVELKSENFLPYLRLANMLRAQGPEATAARRALIEQSVALNDNFVQGQQALGGVLLQAGLFTEALAPARRAVELDPTQVSGHTTLANALARTGKKDEALAETKIAMSLARSDAERRSVQLVIDLIGKIK